MNKPKTQSGGSLKPVGSDPQCSKCGYALVFIRDRNFRDGSGLVWMCANPQCELWQLYVYPNVPAQQRREEPLT